MARKTKPTPGPWNVAKVDDDRAFGGFQTWITASNGHGIARMTTYGPSPKAAANAALIAAAPTLRDALQSLLDAPDSAVAQFDARMILDSLA